MDSRELLAKGSLGTDAAKKLQARTPDDVARRIVERTLNYARDRATGRTMSAVNPTRKDISQE